MSRYFRRWIGVLAATFAGVFLLGAPSQAAVVTINSTVHATHRDMSKDGTVDVTDATAIAVSNSAGGVLLAEDRGILEFDISGLTGPAALAELSLTATGSSWPFASPRTINVQGYTGNGLLDADKSDYFAGSLVTSFVYNNEASVTVDVTAFINAQIALNDAAHFAGFVLLLPVAPASWESVAFGNQINPAYPNLNVSAVPLPAALPLFLTALAGLIFVGRRRRKEADA